MCNVIFWRSCSFQEVDRNSPLIRPSLLQLKIGLIRGMWPLLRGTIQYYFTTSWSVHPISGLIRVVALGGRKGLMREVFLTCLWMLSRFYVPINLSISTILVNTSVGNSSHVYNFRGQIHKLEVGFHFIMQISYYHFEQNLMKECQELLWQVSVVLRVSEWVIVVNFQWDDDEDEVRFVLDKHA